MPQDRRLGWALAAIGMLLVSTDSLFVRLSETDGWNMAFLVSIAALPVFIVLWRMEVRRAQKPTRARPRTTIRTEFDAAAWRALLMVGALGAISSTAFITAITRTDVANVVAIVAAAPIVAAVLARILLGERVAARVWVAMGLTVVGVAFIVGGSLGRPNLSGDLLALVAIVAWATSVVIWRRHHDLSRNLGLAISSILIIIAAAPFAEPFDQEPRAYLAAAAMGLVFSPAGRLAHSSAPRFAPAAEVVLFAPVETVAATLWAWLAFAETPSTPTVIGAVVIIGGVLYGTAGRGADDPTEHTAGAELPA